MIKDIDSFMRNGRENLKYLLSDELRAYYTTEEINKINEKLKAIKNHYTMLLRNTSSPSEFLDKYTEIISLKDLEPCNPVSKIWNQLVEELMIKLFNIYLQKYSLSAKEKFIYYVFLKTKKYYKLKIMQNYFSKYIYQNGKVGLNIVNIYARDIIKRQSKRGEDIDLKLFLFYFKEHYSLSDLVYESMEEYIKLLKRNLRIFKIKKSPPLINHYLAEWKYEDYLAPRLESYEHNKVFYYLYLRARLIECLRESENQLREQLGYKRIGEGNVKEHTLYKELSKVIDPTIIKRWYRPKWLCELELDFYFEANGQKLAVEYQGAQHVRPVKYFGGKKAFKKQISRDRRKLKLCLASDVKLLYCYFDDSIEQFVKEKIKQRLLSG